MEHSSVEHGAQDILVPYVTNYVNIVYGIGGVCLFVLLSLSHSASFLFPPWIIIYTLFLLVFVFHLYSTHQTEAGMKINIKKIRRYK